MTENVTGLYTEFRRYLRRNFKYEKGTPSPVTFHTIVESFYKWEELSEKVLYTLIEEMNGDSPVITPSDTQVNTMYMNLTRGDGLFII